jgi:hypothetical protein
MHLRSFLGTRLLSTVGTERIQRSSARVERHLMTYAPSTLVIESCGEHDAALLEPGEEHTIPLVQRECGQVAGGDPGEFTLVPFP